MIYEAYEKKVRGYLPLTRTIKICVKCAILLLLLSAVALLGYLSLRGIYFGEYTLQSDTVAFGDKPEFDCFVLFGTYRCEYASPGSDDWTDLQPTDPGEYSVRAVITKGFLGKKVYSEPGTVVLFRRNVEVYPDTKRGAGVPYGDDPVFDKHWEIPESLLAKGHYVDDASLLAWEYDGDGGLSATIDLSSVIIRDRNGNNVTDGYDLSTEVGTLKVKKRQISVVVADEVKNGRPVNITKVYDGQGVSTDAYHITKGSLLDDDEITVEATSISANVGKHDNAAEITISSLGQDRTSYYDVDLRVCKIVIEQRPLTVTTPDVTLEYSGQMQFTDAYEITEGSLVSGQSVSLVYNDKTGTTEVTKRPGDNKVQLRITADGDDVTSNYHITYRYGSLTMLPRKIHVRTSDSYGLVYNGMEQSWENYEIEQGSLGPGHRLSVKKAATQTIPGSCENVLEFEILSNGTSVTKNYDLSVSYGTLSVETGAPLVLGLLDLGKTYDASPLDPADYDASKLVSVIGGTLFPGDSIEIVSTSGSQTDAGNSKYSIEYRIVHKESMGKSVDATSWYSSRVANTGTLTVSKRKVTVKYDSITQQYSGDAVPGRIPDLADPTLSDFEGVGHKIVLDYGAQSAMVYSKRGQVVSAPVDVGIYSYSIPTEMFRVVLDDGTYADRTHNYEFAFTGNTIEIRGVSLKLTAPDGSKEYDGHALSAEHFSASSDVKLEWGADGYHATYTLSGSQTNAGTGDLRIENVEVWDRNGNNVTPNFEITTVSGKLIVTPVHISVRSSSGSKVYDGKQMDNATQMTLESGVLVEGHVLGGAVQSDYVTDIGTHENSRVVPRVYTKTGQDVTSNYRIDMVPGTYTITPATMYIKAPVVQGEYSGKTYSGKCDASEYAVGLAKGQKAELEVVSAGIELGTYTMTVQAVSVRDAHGRDVTGNYEISYTDGKLEIVPRRIKIITGSMVVKYEGAPAVNTDLRVGGSGLVQGHEIRAVFTYPYGIFEIGTATNSLDHVRVVDKDGNDVSHYYNLDDRNYGTLRVKPIEITLETDSAYKETYDGQPIAATKYIDLKGNLLEGHRLVPTFKYPDGVADVGKWKNEFADIRVIDQYGDDVTYMYDFKVNAGVLEIANPYVLSMQTFDTEKVYDGMILQSTEYALLGEILPGHAILRINPVTIEMVGEKENRLTLTIVDQEGRDVSRNYEFFYEEGMLGMLRVKHRAMTVTLPDHPVITYNGTPKLTIPLEQLICPELVKGQRISAPLTVESAEVGRKFSVEMGDVRVYDARGRDVTHCYYITLEGDVQSVHVDKAQLELYLIDGYGKEYDGYGVDAELVGYRPIGLVADHFVEYDATSAPAEPGSYTIKFNSWTVYDANGTDVTANYAVTPKTCRVKITPKIIILESESYARHDNGQPLTYPVLKPYKLSGDFEIEPVFTGRQIGVGTSDNIFDVIVYDQDGNVVTQYCDIRRDYGDLEIWGQIDLVLKSGSATAIYDGTALTCHELEPYQLPEGYELVDLVFTGSQTVVGTSKNTFSARIIDTRTNEDVTAYFNTDAWIFGDLTVVRAQDWEVVLKSKDATKNYDGTPLTCFELEPYELPAGYYLADLEFTGSRLNLGSSENTFKVRVVNDSGQELKVECIPGQLVVTLNVTVTAYEKTFTYDGNQKNCGPNDYWTQGLPADGKYRVEVEFDDINRVVTGSQDIVFKKVKIVDDENNDVTEQCNLTVNTAKLTVRPRSLTFYVYGQSADSIKPVQGSLLDQHEIFAEYGTDGKCYIEIADKDTGELVYSNRSDSVVRYTLYDVIIQYG